MRQKAPVNPFYPLVATTGSLFAVTASAFGVVTLRAMRGIEETTGFWRLIDERGPVWMIFEVAALGVVTCGAIGLDSWRQAGENDDLSDRTAKPAAEDSGPE